MVIIKTYNAITEIRNKIDDKDNVSFLDSELLAYLNEAIQYISNYLISVNSPLMIKEVVIENKDFVLPKEYVKSCGTYPIKVTGTKVELIDEPPIKFRYFESYPVVNDMDMELPFNNSVLDIVAIRLAVICAGNQLGADVSQDKTILDEINASIQSAISNAK